MQTLLHLFGLWLGRFLTSGWDKALDAGPAVEHPDNTDDQHLFI